MKRGIKGAIATVSVPALVFLTWMAFAGKAGLGSHPISIRSLYMLPAYVWTGLKSAMEGLSGLSGGGPTLIILLFIFAVTKHEHVNRLSLAAALGGLVFFLLTGVGRSALGIEQAASGRYGYISAALFLPLVAEALSRLARDRWKLAASLAVISWATLHNFGALTGAAGNLQSAQTFSKEVILASAELISANLPLVDVRPEPMWAPDLDVRELREFVRRDALPKAERILPLNRMVAYSNLLVSLDPEGTRPKHVTTLPSSETAPSSGRVDRFGCVSLEAEQRQIRIRFHEPAVLTLRPPADGELSLWLAVDGYEIPLQRTRAFRVKGGKSYELTVATAGTAVLEAGPGAPTNVCGFQIPS